MKGLVLYILILISLITTSCHKQEVKVDYQLIQLSTNQNITSMLIIKDSSLVLTGGILFESGFIAEFKNDTIVFQNKSNKQINDIILKDNELLSTGVDGAIFKKPILSSSWELKRTNVWRIMKGIERNKNRIICVGGESFGSGYISLMDSNFQVIKVDTFKNELADITFFQNKFYAVGYGIVLESQDDGNSWKQLPVFGDFFKSIDFNTNGDALLCGWNGNFYIKPNTQDEWIQTRKNNLNTTDEYFSKAKFVDDNIIFAVGTLGSVFKSSDKGNNWTKLTGLPNVDFTDICLFKNKVYLSAKSGVIVMLE
jgi:hypothetical protein